MTSQSRLRRIRILLVVVVVGLVVSGLTAFPLELETRYLLTSLQPLAPRVPALVDWIRRVHDGLADTGRRYPFISYGTDWLAFAHLVIAVAFWGPLRDPVRNVWVVKFGMIACAGRRCSRHSVARRNWLSSTIAVIAAILVSNWSSSPRSCSACSRA